jgi:transposase InsO family protein
MHKNTKITPSVRREIYSLWLNNNKKGSLRSYAESYHVDKNVIKTVLVRGRLGDFTVHDSANHRYRRIEYGIKRLAAAERMVTLRLKKKEHRENRYERNMPGEMVHGDTRRMPGIYRKDRFRQAVAKSEVLYVWIDDFSRWLMADLLPDKTMWSSSVFLDVMSVRSPFPIQCHYSDNGGEFKGNQSHAFVSGCMRLGIQQRFTKVKHPWPNGKAERVIRSILEEWYRPNEKKFQSAEERRNSLYSYVDWYNHARHHQSLDGLTPAQKLAQFYTESGDNA